MWRGRTECASYRRVRSFSLMLLIASLHEYVLLHHLTSLSLTKYTFRALKSKSPASSLANIARRLPPFLHSPSLRWRFGAIVEVHLLRCGSIATRKTFRHSALSRRIYRYWRVAHSQSLGRAGRR